MAHATATIGTVNFATTVKMGHHELIADEPVALGGQDAGPAPFDLLAASLCTCTAITLRMYAERKGWPLESVQVEARFTRQGKEAQYVDRTLAFTGTLSDEQRQRLAEIADRTPVTLTLRSGVEIRTRIG
ncbi:MAG TPA: OsmC family protein [Steroidobacteraceae bacterium]|nr:OsmC family protein [Steroidobacteraceae bacterium]